MKRVRSSMLTPFHRVFSFDAEATSDVAIVSRPSFGFKNRRDRNRIHVRIHGLLPFLDLHTYHKYFIGCYHYGIYYHYISFFSLFG